MNKSFKSYIDTEDALFHYTTLNIALEHILIEKKLKVSYLREGNDPIEYRERLFPGTCWGLDGQDGIEIFAEGVKAANKILGQCKRISFCASKKPKLLLKDNLLEEDKYASSCGWDRLRMWSQYGDNHKGICLVFSQEGIKKDLQELKNKSKIKDYIVGYMEYKQDTMMLLPTLMINRIQQEGSDEYAEDFILQNREKLFFQKFMDYRDENEFRIIINDPHNELNFLDIAKSIRGVIVGDKVPKVYHPLIKKLCQSVDIDIVGLSFASRFPCLYKISDNE